MSQNSREVDAWQVLGGPDSEAVREPLSRPARSDGLTPPEPDDRPDLPNDAPEEPRDPACPVCEARGYFQPIYGDLVRCVSCGEICHESERIP